MIIKCLQIYNYVRKEILEIKQSDRLTVGKKYQVLELSRSKKELLYRIIDDSGNIYFHPILVRSNEFEIVSFKIPPNWVIRVDDGECLQIGPKRWLDNSIWHYSFWEDWDEGCEKAMKCYEEELTITLGADPL